MVFTLSLVKGARLIVPQICNVYCAEYFLGSARKYKDRLIRGTCICDICSSLLNKSRNMFHSGTFKSTSTLVNVCTGLIERTWSKVAMKNTLKSNYLFWRSLIHMSCHDSSLKIKAKRWGLKVVPQDDKICWRLVLIIRCHESQTTEKKGIKS